MVFIVFIIGSRGSGMCDGCFHWMIISACLSAWISMCLFCLKVKVSVKLTSSLWICLHLPKEEKLDGDNRYFCESCESKQSATRRIRLHSLPPTLNLQLMRFVFDRSATDLWCFVLNQIGYWWHYNGKRRNGLLINYWPVLRSYLNSLVEDAVSVTCLLSELPLMCSPDKLATRRSSTRSSVFQSSWTWHLFWMLKKVSVL